MSRGATTAVDGERLLAELGIPIESRQGSELWACCPYPDHDEKKASWSLNENNGYHSCFGCGEGGGVVALVAGVIGIGYGGARGWLEEHGFLDDSPRNFSGAEVVLRSPGDRRTLDVPFGISFGPLEQWVTPARRYMARKDRRVNAWQVQRWGIGYAAAGRLDGRIFFPVYTRAGELRNYHARDFTGALAESNGRPRQRFLYPAHSDGSDPDAMFGERHWPERGGEVVVTEAAFDALACELAGAASIAAIGGSERSAVPKKLAKLVRFDLILVCTDNDRAGNRVADLIRAELCRHVPRVRRVQLPDGLDACKVAHEELVKALRAARIAER